MPPNRRVQHISKRWLLLKIMKFTLLISCLLLLPHIGFAQSQTPSEQNSRKGRLYFYWGRNRGRYSKSDIKFNGTDYEFTLKNVAARDKQSNFSINTYFNPSKATLPQYNFRVGYFIKNNWDISFGIDHMKYVVRANQTVKISGHIENTQTIYDGMYLNSDISITDDFLKFEHPDGLNYVNIELRRSDKIFDFNKIKISLTEGLGTGFLVPKTNTTLLNKERHDKFHLSGYGINSVIGINVSFLNKFFVQSEFKVGYINMHDIRTTKSQHDRASQSFFFSQVNFVFGAIINLNNSPD